MHKLRILLPSLGLCALILGGCIITQAQVFAHFDLPNPFTIDSSTHAFDVVHVDLNTISEYRKHKDNLKGLSDVAVVGKFTNVAGPAGNVQIWITPGTTNLADANAITSGATLMWSGSIGATGSVHNVDWNESAKLFTPAGKKILIDEAKGDGQFTIYTIGTSGVYNITVDNGSIILVIDGGV